MSDELPRKVFAYGVAVKLKELEASGKIDEMLKRIESAKSRMPQHKVVKFANNTGNDFTYEFVIELAETPDNLDKVKLATLKTVGDLVKDEYMDVFPNADESLLSLDYLDFNVDGRKISGRIAVLSIKPLSLSYDANTRHGKMSVRLNANQCNEARAWCRKNIETLARDKNMALVAGQLPPSAVFYLLNEKVEGNVMEIEFRTE